MTDNDYWWHRRPRGVLIEIKLLLSGSQIVPTIPDQCLTSRLRNLLWRWYAASACVPWLNRLRLLHA